MDPTSPRPRPRSLRSARAFLLLAPALAAACGEEALDPGAISTPPAPAPAAQVAPASEPAAPERGAEEALPGRSGDVRRGTFDTPLGRLDLTYELIDGQRVFQGDVLLPPEVGPQYRSGGIAALDGRWTYGIVPVESTNLFADSRVTKAIEHWQQRAAIRFVFGATTGNRLRFVDPGDRSVCSSHVGKQGTDVQLVNLGANCDTGSAIHEIGHAIGLFHEQSRNDRGSFVTINSGCIQSGKEHNFDTFGAAGLNIGAYDFGSIMHYGSTAFLDKSVKGCKATITRLDGKTIDANRTALSNGDVAGAGSLYLPWTAVRRGGNFSFGTPDIAVWRRSNATWRVNINGKTVTKQWGEPTDIPVPADYDNDFVADFAVWRPRTGEWFVLPSRGGSATSTQWGEATDVPAHGDFNGDGRTDRAVFRPREGNWYVLITGGSSFVREWGTFGDIPVPADYDGDGLTDLAVWRPSDGNWWVIKSSNGESDVRQWGVAGDVPVPGYYDRDGKVDFAVWRPSNGTWYVRQSADDAAWEQQWGVQGDVPAPLDHDGDGVTDRVVFRPHEGNWYVVRSSNGSTTVQKFGEIGDVPVP